MKTTYAEFLDRTVVLSNGCRIPVSIRWPGKELKMTWDGYMQVTVDGRRGRAHKVAWELANGPVPKGLTLDHLCRNRICCEVAHLEPITNRENVLRGDLPEVARQHMRRVSVIRRKCAECDLESNTGGMGLHHKASGHRGFENIVPNFDLQTSGG